MQMFAFQDNRYTKLQSHPTLIIDVFNNVLFISVDWEKKYIIDPKNFDLDVYWKRQLCQIKKVFIVELFSFRNSVKFNHNFCVEAFFSIVWKSWRFVVWEIQE